MTDDRPEINIKPWDALQKELNGGNKRVKWLNREPYAYWKGNPDVAVTRQELVKCNVSSEHEWNARIYKQVLCFSLCYITLSCTRRICDGPVSSHEQSSIILSILLPIKCLNPSELVGNYFFNETVLVMMTHD
jgi:hypothetical protein